MQIGFNLKTVTIAIEINMKKKKKPISPLHADILKKYAKPGRNPDKALTEMYGLWEGRDITIESIRARHAGTKSNS